MRLLGAFRGYLRHHGWASQAHGVAISINPMAVVRIHVGITPAQLKSLEKLAAKLGMDRTNTIRYCISRTLEAENIHPSSHR